MDIQADLKGLIDALHRQADSIDALQRTNQALLEVLLDEELENEAETSGFYLNGQPILDPR